MQLSVQVKKQLENDLRTDDGNYLIKLSSVMEDIRVLENDVET